MTACATACLVARAHNVERAHSERSGDPGDGGLGDSLTRGWGREALLADTVSASWSTGTDAAVNSHFQRLSPLRPGLTASNVAVSGSKMAATSTQADAAVSAGAMYVTLLSGTNDACTASVGVDDERRDLHDAASDDAHEAGGDSRHDDPGRFDSRLVLAVERSQDQSGRALAWDTRASVRRSSET